MIKQSQKIVVLLMGKPGAGKGTQADILRDKLGLVHFNTGEVIRHCVANPQTPEDRREKENYVSGRLTTFTWVARLVKEEARKYAKAGQGIVFSGSPRSLYEARQLLPQIIADYGKDKVVAIILNIDDELAVKRNSGRLTCDSCGFTMTPNPARLSKVKGSSCGQCGGKLIQRVIDQPEIIREKRLPEYYKNTAPTIDFIRKLGIARDLDGRKGIPQVAWEIEQIIDHVVNKVSKHKIKN